MHEQPDAAHVAHPGIGTDLESGGCDDRAVLCGGHKVVVVGAKRGEKGRAVRGAAGGEAQGVFKHAGHPPQGGDPRRISRFDGADGIVHKGCLPELIFATI